MNLTASTHSLELVTASAVNTTFEASWAEIDKTSTTAVVPGSNHALVTTPTDTTLVAAPSGANLYRAISSVSICNVGGASQSVTVQKDVSGTEYEVARATLAAGQSLKYERHRGWYVLTAAGEVSQAGQVGADGADGAVAILEATVDFGVTPTDEASVVVVDAGISTSSVFLCAISGGSTADNNADAHAFMALDAAVWAVPAAGSVTIYVRTRSVLATGDFKVRYVYS